MPIQATLTETDYQSAATALCRRLDRRQGMFFRSGTDIPGRYSRWDLGLCDPAMELRSRGRMITLAAQDSSGERLLSLFAPALRADPGIARIEVEKTILRAYLHPMGESFAEEQRSRQPSLFTALRSLLSTLTCDDPYLGFYGAFGYDLVFQFEPITLRQQRADDMDDAVLFLPLSVLVVDRRKETAHWHHYLIDTPQGPAGPLPSVEPVVLETETGPSASSPTITADQTPEKFMDKVRQVQQGCARGDYFEVVLSQEFRVPCQEKGSVLFERLSRRNPSPYLFYFNLGREQLIGSSPEMFLRVEGTGADGPRTIETCPIAGTVRRGGDAVEDAEARARLYGSLKDEAELTMCTDVDRNDLSRVCTPGSVQLLGRRLLETYSKLIHTVDHVRGELLPEYDALDGFASHMWACTVTGAPKKIAMQTIENLEESPRGYYAGAIGFLSSQGQLNSGITLRTLHLRDGVARIRAGATLLYDSDPRAEEEETRLKAAALLDAILHDDEIRSAPQRPQFGAGRTVLFVDCEDSFVQTLASYVRATGAKVATYRPGFPRSLLGELAPDLLFLSPGPKTPKDFNLDPIIGWAVSEGIPLFGVCLGHQGIAEYFGAKLGVLPEPVHGKPAAIIHDSSALFAGLPSPFTAARYHSLYVVEETLPADLIVTARSQDSVIMALQHRTLPIASVQFHPESILSQKKQAGWEIINNLFKWIAARCRST